MSELIHGHGPDIKRIKGLRDLAGRIARAHARRWFTQGEGLALPTPEQFVEARRFHPDQLKGLREAGYAFLMEVRPVSVGQLYSDEATKPLFGYVNESSQMRDVVPVAREVVINPNLNPDPRYAVFLAGSENLPFDAQQGKLETYVRDLRKKNFRKGTLEGVDFAMDHASVYVQLDFANQRVYGRNLIVNGWARTIDETYVNPGFGPNLANVGRRFRNNLLVVSGWTARGGFPDVRVIPVASPVGNR